MPPRLRSRRSDRFREGASVLGGSARCAVADVIPLGPKGLTLGLEEEGMHPADVLPPVETSDNRSLAARGKFPQRGSPGLEGLNFAMEHDVCHIDKGNAFAEEEIHSGLQGIQLLLVPSGEVLGRPGMQPLQWRGRESRDSFPVPQ